VVALILAVYHKLSFTVIMLGVRIVGLNKYYLVNFVCTYVLVLIKLSVV
jgi:hypothetical protein